MSVPSGHAQVSAGQKLAFVFAVKHWKRSEVREGNGISAPGVFQFPGNKSVFHFQHKIEKLDINIHVLEDT